MTSSNRRGYRIKQISHNFRYADKKVFVGVDGCSAGWFAVFLATEAEKNCEWGIGLFTKFQFRIDFLIKKYEQIEPLILIDIPIGLKNGGKGERLPDLGARRILKARKSSIFPIPCREAVYMESYKKACEVNEKLTGKRISKQAWNIVSKIRDVNNFLVENEIFRKKKGSGTWNMFSGICRFSYGRLCT